MTTSERHLSRVLDGLLGALDSLVLAWITAYRVREPVRGQIARALEQTHHYLDGSRQHLEAALLTDEDAMTDEHARAVFERIQDEIIEGRAHWVARLPEYEPEPLAAMTAEQRRRYERERKARQRATPRADR